MRALSFHILLMAMLVAVVTGCGGMHRYDGRLTAADSLMHDNPDSALAIIMFSFGWSRSSAVRAGDS